MRVTNHGRDRLKERLGLRSAAAERLADRAFAEGLSMQEATGPLKRHLDGMFYRGGYAADNLRVYGEFVYVFCGVALVTCVPLPRELRKIAIKQQKR